MTDQEINEAVARKLMPDETIIASRVKDYCHSIEAAWEIIRYMEKDFSWSISNYEEGEYEIWFENDEQRLSPEYNFIEAKADTPAMAICKAFLRLP